MNKKLALIAIGLATLLHIVVKCEGQKKATSIEEDDELKVTPAVPMG